MSARYGETQSRKRAAANCFKNIAKFLLSRVGISIMVILYCIIGGFVFQYVERTNEKQECINNMVLYNDLEDRIKADLWNVSKVHINRNHSENEQIERVRAAVGDFKKLLEEFRDQVLNITYDGEDCERMGEEGGPGYRWTFPMAFQFSMSVVTTIGKCYQFVLCITVVFLIFYLVQWGFFFSILWPLVPFVSVFE